MCFSSTVIFFSVKVTLFFKSINNGKLSSYINDFHNLQDLQSHHDKNLVIKGVEKHDDEKDGKMEEKKIPQHVGHPVSEHPHARNHLNHQWKTAILRDVSSQMSRSITGYFLTDTLLFRCVYASL